MGHIEKYIVKQGDNLQNIAGLYLGDPSRWFELTIYNNLTYPFLTSDPNWTNVRKAQGYVEFETTATFAGLGYGQEPFGDGPFGSDVATFTISIPVGTIVTTTPVKVFGTPDYQRKRYITLQPAIIGSTSLRASVLVEAIEPGEIGNTSELTITEIESPVLLGVTVYNLQPIKGGETVNVKKPGDILLILVSPTKSDGIIDNPDFDVNAAILGTDVYLHNPYSNWSSVRLLDESADEGDLIPDVYEDVETVAGLDNLKQALAHRLITERGELKRHPDYGSNILAIVGTGGTFIKTKLIELEVSKTLRSDPRISDITDLTITKNGDVYEVTCSAIVIGRDEGIPLSFGIGGKL